MVRFGSSWGHSTNGGKGQLRTAADGRGVRGQPPAGAGALGGRGKQWNPEWTPRRGTGAWNPGATLVEP
jgi:hypothetical protein